MKPAKSQNELSLDQAYRELQQIVEEFENEDVNLETSLPKFQRGLELAAMLKTKLGKLKNEVEEIKAKFAEPISTDDPL